MFQLITMTKRVQIWHNGYLNIGIGPNNSTQSVQWMLWNGQCPTQFWPISSPGLIWCTIPNRTWMGKYRREFLFYLHCGSNTFSLVGFYQCFGGDCYLHLLVLLYSRLYKIHYKSTRKAEKVALKIIPAIEMLSNCLNHGMTIQPISI